MIFFFSSTGLVMECNASVYEQLGFNPSEDIWLQDIFRTCIKVYDDRLIFKDGMFEQWLTPCEITSPPLQEIMPEHHNTFYIFSHFRMDIYMMTV